jgi:cytochrome c oxidase subunit 4
MSPDQHVEEEHGLKPMQYVWIGLALAIITFIELWASLWVDLGSALIPVLVFFSAVKFIVVVAFFMHLYFEPRILTHLFAGSFVLASGVMIGLLSLFWNDITDLFNGV